MQKANQILQAIRKLGEKRIPLTRVYRNLYCEELFLLAYDKIQRNQGALTEGTEDDTVDGFNLRDVRKLIELLRHERFYFRPSRRIQIPKKSKGKRPLGIPNFTEKLMQEVLRMVLEAYYEPRFRDSSHGFRPERGCHTALRDLKKKFMGTVWFIEGDIKACFDNIDHEVLMNILSRDIHDGRLLSLIQRSLDAGYMEKWQYHKTYSGTPQGGVLSPLLSNIVLNELDTFIEDHLIPQNSRGKNRRMNPEYQRLSRQINKAQTVEDVERVQDLIQQRRQIPSGDRQDRHFRRLKYIRYADDFILGFIGSKSETKQIKSRIAEFLRNELNLTLNEDKTLITHARTKHARFLGYDISVQHANDKLTQNSQNKNQLRSVNGTVRLGLPYGLITELAKPYQQHGKTISEATLVFHSDVQIIETFQSRFRGIAEYYKYAVDRTRLGELKHIMEQSLVKTLAEKYKISVRQVYAKYSSKLEVDDYEYKILVVDVPTQKGTRRIYWGAIPLKVVRIGHGILIDRKPLELKYARTDLIQRIQAETCELCGSTKNVEVHHIRKLADLKRKWAGRKTKPKWVIRMIAIQRKSLVVCQQCHYDIHAGRPIPN